MVKKDLIKEIENKLRPLGWDTDDVKLAIRELEDVESLLDPLECLDIFVNSKNLKQRIINFADYFENKYKGSLVDAITELLMLDPCLNILAIFNLSDFVKYGGATNQYPQLIVDYLGPTKSFVRWKSYQKWAENSIRIIRIPAKLDYDSLFNGKGYNPPTNRGLYDFNTLSYALIENMLDKVFKGKQDSNKLIRDLLVEVLPRVGFLVFNIQHFLEAVTRHARMPNLGAPDDVLLKLAKSLSDKYSNRRSITERNNWLLYALVETAKEKGIGTRASFKVVGGIMNQPHTTVHRRYYERKNIAKEEEKSLGEVIKEHNLRNEVDKFIQRLLNN